MSKTDFNEFIHYRALAAKFEANGEHLSQLLDPLIDAEHPIVPPVKNVCAKLSVELSDLIDLTAGQLGISKRKFIEIALIQLVEHSQHVMECVGTIDAIEDAAQAVLGEK
jgi:hypothetical protein